MPMETLLVWLIVGAVSGWLAGQIVKGGGFGLLGDIVVGIIGAFVGGVVMSFAGGRGVTGFNLYSFGVALLGAVITLFVARKITGR